MKPNPIQQPTDCFAPRQNLITRFLKWSGGDIPTNNPGTGFPPEDEKLKVLKSIDAKLDEINKRMAAMPNEKS